MVNGKYIQSNLTRSQYIFLKERGLLQAFKRAKNLERQKKITVEQDGRKQSLILTRELYKKQKTTVIRDFFSLRKLGSSKRSIKSTESDLKTRAEKTSFLFGKQLKTNFYKKRLNEIQRTPLTNFVLNERTNPYRKKLGQMYIDVTFYAKGKKRTVEGGSHSPADLSIKSNKLRAFNEAFAGALSLIDFSYETFRINFIHYSYFIPKRKIQPVFHAGAAEAVV